LIRSPPRKFVFAMELAAVVVHCGETLIILQAGRIGRGPEIVPLGRI
jgi:hypothetical protein